MRILAIADEECQALWDYYMPGKLKGVDLIISCGDLKSDYLQFLVTMGRAPLLYVHGNHDTHYSTNPPEGCECIEDKVIIVDGLRILGLGGCRRYHPGEHQYTEREMRRRIRKLRFRLWWTKGVDIVVTHAPPRDLGDAPDPAHIGFEALVELIDKYHPKLLLHGHVHKSYGAKLETEHHRGDTRILNVGERTYIDI